MKETELKLHPCHCGGEIKMKKVAQDGGMDGTYWDWKLTCKKCGLTKTYAADGFYGRKYKTFEEVVDDWNLSKKKELCEDCISRKNTLAEFKRLYFDNDAVIRCAELVLGSMPSVTPQPKWIPVSERLPEESGYYLVTVFVEDCYFLEVCLRWFAHPNDYEITIGEWRECEDGESVAAWIPLPEPFAPDTDADSNKESEVKK